jgi:hypothetical protein
MLNLVFRTFLNTPEIFMPHNAAVAYSGVKSSVGEMSGDVNLDRENLDQILE